MDDNSCSSMDRSRGSGDSDDAGAADSTDTDGDRTECPDRTTTLFDL